MNLFSDNFESGDLSEWDDFSTDGGDLSVSIKAALHGDYGLKCVVDDTNYIGVDELFSNALEFRCRFYIDTNSISMTIGNEFTLFQARESSWGDVSFDITLYNNGGNYELRTNLYVAGVWDQYINSGTISDGVHYIEVHYKSHVSTGGFQVWVDGVSKGSDWTVSNANDGVAHILFGALYFDGGESGTIYLDDFVSNDDGSAIGVYTAPGESDIESIAYPIKVISTKEINGPWTALMQIKADDYISSEGYVELSTGLYIVKKLRRIKSKGMIYYNVNLDHYMSELSGITIERMYLKDTIANLLAHILSDSDWNSGIVDLTGTILLDIDRRVSVLEALNLLAEKAEGELNFNNNRTVDLKEEIGTVTKLQLRYDKNCDYIEKEEDSTNLITRIYPYGPDNLSINTIVIQNMDDSTEWAASGTSISADITAQKMEGSGCVQFTDNGPGDTLTIDLGAGDTLDLSGIDTVTFWVFDPGGSGLDFDTSPIYFGIGEAAWDDNKFTITGSVNADSWRKVEVDISGVADADKNAIRYIGFQGGGGEYYFDDIKASGIPYLDSPKRRLYKVNKEYVYFHSTEANIKQRTISIPPTDDARVYQGAAGSNFGSLIVLAVRDESPYSEISFVKFSMEAIPENAVVTSAALKMYVSNVIGGGETVEASFADKNWDEEIVTWTNKPGAGDNIGSVSMTDTGWYSITFTGAVSDWRDGTRDNHGIRLEIDIVPDAHKGVHINSKENSEYQIWLEVAYTLSEETEDVLQDAAQAYLNDHDEPKLKYKVKMANLSKAIVDTWEDETISLGDTIRVYDSELGINVDCRVKKIIENLLDPINTMIELTNRAYDITDMQSVLAKKIKYVMPFEDNTKIINANAVQKGYLGGEVGGI